MLNLSSLSTQSLASCVNYFVWNCFTCFSNTKIGSVTSSFDIVQFSRSCTPQPWRLTTWLFYHRSGFLSSTFFRSCWTFWTWNVQWFLGASRNFWTSIGSFQGLPAGLSEVILLPQRLALKYNTTPPLTCQHFLTSFFQFLCGALFCHNPPWGTFPFRPLTGFAADSPLYLVHPCVSAAGALLYLYTL